MDKTIYADYETGFSFKTFKSAIRTQKTFRTYRHCLYDFVKFTGLKTYDDILKLEQKELQDKLKEYIIHDSEKGLRGTSIRAKLCAIELFLDINDKPYNKKLIHRLIPINDDVSSGDVPFTREDIQRMLECTTSLRTKAIIHFLASTGVRPASIVDPVLRMKHLADMSDNCKAIKIYDKSKSGYWAFLTPEASKALHEYFQSRKLNGEVLNEESPVFSNRTDAHNIKQDNLSGDSLTRIIYNLLRKAGIERIKTGNRYDKAMVYGFRKRFNTILKLNNNVNSNVAEKLMAHKRGLDGSYLKPTREECFSEFAKAVFDLTISDKMRQKVTIGKLEKEKAEIETIKERFEYDHQFLQVLAHGVKDLGIQIVYPDGTPYEVDPEVIKKVMKDYVKPVKISIDESLAKNKIEIKV